MSKLYKGKYKDQVPYSDTLLDKCKSVLTSEEQILFIIERNTNKNCVCYIVNIADNAIDEKEPVNVQWIMWEKDGSGKAREGLNLIERNTAYGITVTDENNKYKLTIVSLKSIPVSIEFNNETKEAKAYIIINGKKAQLIRLYVFTVKNWVGMPSVEYTDVFVKFEGSDEIVNHRICA